MARAPDDSPWSSSILAGGHSKRFGSPKFLSRVGGETLIRRVARAVMPPGGDLMVVVGREEDPETQEVIADELGGIGSIGPGTERGPRLRFVRDTPGPKTLAAGIEAALVSGESDIVFVAASDLPFLDRGLVLHLVERVRGYAAAVPFYRGFYEPACAVYSKRMLPVISRYRRHPGGPLSTCFTDPTVAAARVTEDEIRRFGEPDMLFLNVNTRDDLDRAQAAYLRSNRREPERGVLT